MYREYEEIPVGVFRSTQQTNLADDAVTELNTEITRSDATGGNDQNRPDTDLFAERTLPAEPNSFVDFSAEVVENVAYESVEAKE